MAKTSYYKIDDGTVTGSIAILDVFPEAEIMSRADFLAHGYIQFSIPDDVLTIFPRYKDGKFTIDPPPYWDELGLSMAKLPISQRIIAYSVGNTAIGAVFTMIVASISFKDYPSLKNSLGRVVDVLNYNQMPITPEEMTGLTDLLLECGFTEDVWAEMID